MVDKAWPKWDDLRRMIRLLDMRARRSHLLLETTWRFIDMTSDGTRMVAAAQQGGGMAGPRGQRA